MLDIHVGVQATLSREGFKAEETRKSGVVTLLPLVVGQLGVITRAEDGVA
jgi:hypothetical protein